MREEVEEEAEQEDDLSLVALLEGWSVGLVFGGLVGWSVGGSASWLIY